MLQAERSDHDFSGRARHARFAIGRIANLAEATARLCTFQVERGMLSLRQAELQTWP